MQFAQITPSTSAQKPSIFKFGQNDIRVFGHNHEPWFAATDIAKGLGIQNFNKALSNLRECERSTLKVERGGYLVIVSESGLYTMILRSDSAIKEGTPAFNFRVWVTDDLLPALRKTGQYSTSEKSSAVVSKTEITTITPAQQLAIQQAVGRRAQKTANHYQTIYRAIKLRYQIARYDQLSQDKFEDCLKFIDEMGLNVPESVQNEEPKPISVVKGELEKRYAVINSDEVIVRKDSVMKLLNEAERTLDQIRGLESHLMGCVHETIFRVELSRNA